MVVPGSVKGFQLGGSLQEEDAKDPKGALETTTPWVHAKGLVQVFVRLYFGCFKAPPLGRFYFVLKAGLGLFQPFPSLKNVLPIWICHGWWHPRLSIIPIVFLSLFDVIGFMVSQFVKYPITHY